MSFSHIAGPSGTTDTRPKLWLEGLSGELPLVTEI
jgi:hypothetical protein